MIKTKPWKLVGLILDFIDAKRWLAGGDGRAVFMSRQGGDIIIVEGYAHSHELGLDYGREAPRIETKPNGPFVMLPMGGGPTTFTSVIHVTQGIMDHSLHVVPSEV